MVSDHATTRYQERIDPSLSFYAAQNQVMDRMSQARILAQQSDGRTYWFHKGIVYITRPFIKDESIINVVTLMPYKKHFQGADTKLWPNQ